MKDDSVAFLSLCFPPTHCQRWCFQVGPWSKSTFRFPHWSHWLYAPPLLLLLLQCRSQRTAVKSALREFAHLPKTHLDDFGYCLLYKNKWRGKKKGNALITTIDWSESLNQCCYLPNKAGSRCVLTCFAFYKAKPKTSTMYKCDNRRKASSTLCGFESIYQTVFGISFGSQKASCCWFLQTSRIIYQVGFFFSPSKALHCIFLFVLS